MVCACKGPSVARVSIVSIHSNNCGNRLQAYALRQVLHRELGERVRIESLRIPAVRQTPPLRRRVTGKAKRMVKKALGIAAPAAVDNRTPLFESFTDRYIPTIHTADATSMAERDGVFVIGSDQCWNPSFEIGTRTDGAQCAASVSAARKITYAASFGITWDNMPDEWRARYAEWLAGFAPNSISMREDAGAECVRKLCGADAQVVLDPTMLLSADEWAAIERRPQIANTDKPFCLKYVLGDNVNSSAINQTCEERGLVIIDLRDTSLAVGPAEFVWLVRHSQLVCTDSFHASAFSILFKRPFIIFERQQEDLRDMSSRFDTLARMFGIEDHRASSASFSWNAVWECN